LSVITVILLASAAALLAASSVLASVGLSLVQVSESALERALEDRGAASRGRWMLGRLEQVEWAVAFARTAMRIGFVACVFAAFAGFDEPLTAWRLLAAWAVAVLLLWAFTSVAAGAFARHAPAAVIVRFLLPLRALHATLLPVRALARGVDRAVGSSVGRADPVERSEDELVSAIEDTQRQGLIDEHAAEILENAVTLGDATVGGVMTPRPRIEAIAYTDDLEAVREFAIRSGHSRIPVHSGSLDHVQGILYVKDLVRFLGRPSSDFRLRPLLRQPMRIPESKPIQEQLRDFQQSKVHVAIVMDEFGGTAGLVTIEDILEELVGEIRDEHEPASDSAPTLWKAADGAFEASGHAPVADLNAALGLGIPEDDGYETVAGFVLARFGSIPRVGDSFSDSGVRFTVLEATPAAVQRVRAERLPETP
jgi:CBS domain containing-hemolysin-like protein